MKIVIDLDTVDPPAQVAAQVTESYPVTATVASGSEVRVTGDLDDVITAVADVWGTGDWREAVEHVEDYSAPVAQVELARKVAEMLSLREQGALKRTGDDFISGLVAAYRMMSGEDTTVEAIIEFAGAWA